MWAEMPDVWLQEVKARNKEVWDFRRRRFAPLVHLGALRQRIMWWQRMQRAREWWECNKMRVQGAVVVVLLIVAALASAMHRLEIGLLFVCVVLLILQFVCNRMVALGR